MVSCPLESVGNMNNGDIMATRKNGGRGPTIRDVALVADVSVSTVSRYLNEPSKVAISKQERIAEAIAKLNYHPSAVAQAFSRGTTQSIAVLVSSLKLYGPQLTIEAIESHAMDCGYSVNILAIKEETLPMLASRLTAQNPAGAILIAYDKTGLEALRYLPDSLPLISLHGDVRDLPGRHISLNSYQGGRQVTEHLLSLGHETVYHVSVPAREAGPGRLQGWRDALASKRRPAPMPIEAGWSPKDGYRAGLELAKADDCTAIFAGNDEIAMGVVAGLAAGGKRVPEDVSVAGLDAHPLSAVCMPPLTTYRLKFEEAGEAAFDLLTSKRENSGDCLEFTGELIVRESTAAPRL